MQDDHEKLDTTPAPPLSAEFLSGGTAAGLEKIRARLLDLTNRNRLLNFRHTIASSLRIVDAELDAVFARLLNGEEIPFRPVSEPKLPPVESSDEGEIAKPLAADHAESLGWYTSYDLTTPSRHNADSRCLPVLHYVEDLETLTRKIGSAAKTAIEESGTNMLYLTLGFLEWYESDDSRQTHIAPLVTVPVALNREAAKGKGFEATLEYSGEDFGVNLSLVEKMRRDFAVEIPSFEEEDTPNTYFARFEPILAQRQRWKIRRHITLSLLSFGKLLMYRDLDAKIWPVIAKHHLVTELFEGRKNDTITHAEEHPIDAPELKHEIPPLVVDADSSQHSALIDAMRGQNLVIEGPPGTGKSQTITNLIAAALTNGKTVLFVSDKLAALEVVRRRLDEAGLGMFCLELHSHKTRKDSLLNDLATRLKVHGSFRDPKELDQQLAIAEEKKRLLTRYVALINKELHPYDATVFEVLWARDVAYQELPFDRSIVESLVLPAVIQFTRTNVIGTDLGVFGTEDHGRTWQELTSTLTVPGYPYPERPGVETVAIDPVDSRRIYAGTFNRGIIVTDDGGHTWRRATPYLAVMSLAVDPRSPHDVFAAVNSYMDGRSGVLVSRDRGKTWDWALLTRDTPTALGADRQTVYASGPTDVAPYAARLNWRQGAYVPSFASYLMEGTVGAVATTALGESVMAFNSGRGQTDVAIVRIAR
jgi:hypothetical protein